MNNKHIRSIDRSREMSSANERQKSDAALQNEKIDGEMKARDKTGFGWKSKASRKPYKFSLK